MKNLTLIFLSLILYSCTSKTTKREVAPAAKFEVITVNYPLHYFADRIAGDLIDLKYMIPNNIDPAYWILNESELIEYQQADLIIANGAGYAGWLDNVSLASSKVVYTLSNSNDDLIKLKSGKTHSHGPEGEHEHVTFAITTWLDFKLALIQAEAIKDELVKKIPENESIFNENFKSLQKDLNKLDDAMVKASTIVKESNNFGSHPVYQYLSKGYDLNISSIHFEPNEMPKKEQWDNLNKMVDHSKRNIMFWEGEPNQEIKDKMTSLKIDMLVFDPCANKPENGDYLSIMKANVSRLNKD